MKILKSQLFLITCVTVVLLAIGAEYWPIHAYRAELEQQMEERLGKVAQADSAANYTIAIPGIPNQKGAVTQEIIDIRNQVQKDMADQAEKISARAAIANSAGRIKKDNGRVIPLLGGEPMDRFLPKLDPSAADPHVFSAAYESLLTVKWLEQLGASAPPAKEDVDRQWQDTVAQRAALASGAAAGGAAQDEDERKAFYRSRLAEKAASIRVYATTDSFQRRSWLSSGDAPNEAQIFEAIVDCWIMQDLVDTIKKLNAISSGVEMSPVKRLGPIAIGAQAKDGTLVMSSAGASYASAPTGFSGHVASDLLFLKQNPLATPGSPYSSAAGNPLPEIDVSRSLTGRMGSSRFDVTHVRLVLDLNQSSVNDFINELYKKSNAYTVLNVRLEAVDPFEAAANGYLYGKVPVVRADMLFEVMFFRKWTSDIMPDVYKDAVGQPLVPQP